VNKKLLSALSALALLPVAIPAHADRMTFSRPLLKFHTMVGNTAPYTVGGGARIRGILGGPFPWDITRAVGELRSNGDLHIRVKGLIIPASAGKGFNPAPYFQAVVSCRTLTANSAGKYYRNMVTPKADTRMIGNTRRGDAVINGKVKLPDPCIAPIVFVTSPAKMDKPTGYWFAATGNQTTSGNMGSMGDRDHD